MSPETHRIFTNRATIRRYTGYILLDPDHIQTMCLVTVSCPPGIIIGYLNYTSNKCPKCRELRHKTTQTANFSSWYPVRQQTTNLSRNRGPSKPTIQLLTSTAPTPTTSQAGSTRQIKANPKPEETSKARAA